MLSLDRITKRLMASIAIVSMVVLASCASNPSVDTTAPKVTTVTPTNGATNVATNPTIIVTFDEAINASSLTNTSVTLTQANATPVPGTVTYDTNTTSAIFTPNNALNISTEYTMTLTTAIEDEAGNPLANEMQSSFTTAASVSAIQPIDLGTAGDFVILAKSKVTTTGTTAIVGDIGISPAARSYVTGFADTLDASRTFSTSDLVTGKIYAADMAVPTPAKMTSAIGDMETAYTDAAGRTSPNFTELGAGDISGLTLVPGLYKWGTGVSVTTNVTLSGGPNDVWILQIANDLTIANGATVTLIGGAQPQNVFWQIAGQATLGTGSTFAGILLSKTQIVFQTDAAMNGRALAQTAVALDANAVTQP